MSGIKNSVSAVIRNLRLLVHYRKLTVRDLVVGLKVREIKTYANKPLDVLAHRDFIVGDFTHKNGGIPMVEFGTRDVPGGRLRHGRFVPLTTVLLGVVDGNDIRTTYYVLR